MKNMMQQILGNDWDQLPVALQEHYRAGHTVEHGVMDIEFPLFMVPFLTLLRLVGALINHAGRAVETKVEKKLVGDRWYWWRTMQYADGRSARFNSVWMLNEQRDIVEFVNPYLALTLRPRVEAGRLHLESVCFVIKFGRYVMRVPEWLVLGRSIIVEEALEDDLFRMDFKMIHPLLGQIFRYSGQFRVGVGARAGAEAVAKASIHVD